MSKALIIIALLFSTLAFGQVSKKTVYENINGLTIVDSVSYQDIVGGFSVSNGFSGYYFQLDSNMTFEKIDFSCEARFKIDSGLWSVRNKNTLVLKSTSTTLYFDVVKFDDFYFFIQPKQRQKFVADLKATKIKLKNAKPFKIDGRTYSPDYLVGYDLLKKYFAKDIQDITGT